MNKLTELSDFNADNLIFTLPLLPTDKSKKQLGKRISITTKHTLDNSVSSLVFATEELFSYGIKVFTNEENSTYSFSINLFSVPGGTEREREFLTVFNDIVEKCKEFLVENKRELGFKNNFDMSDLKNFNPLWYPTKDDGEVDTQRGPTLYCKLISSKKSGVITKFYDTMNQDISYEDLINQRCRVRAAVKVESIFIGTKASLQVKLVEANVEVLQTTRTRLLVDKTLTCQASSPPSEEEPVGEPMRMLESKRIVNSDDEEVRAPVQRTIQRRAPGAK
jgi:hypothetical protein